MRFISAKSSYKSKCSAKVPPGVPLNRHRPIGGCGALHRCGCARTYEGTQFLCVKFRLGSAGEPTICSHCYSVPYMKIPANNQVLLNTINHLMFRQDLYNEIPCQKKPGAVSASG